MDNLNFATLNTNGLRSRTKLNKLQKFFYKNKLDFIFLQETHYAPGLNNFWTQKWRGKAVWAGKSINEAGVGIVFNEKISVEITKTEIDKDGRYLILNCKIKSNEYTLICVYVPDIPTTRNKFMEKIFLPVLKNTTIRGEIIMGGDFNCVENIKYDRINGIGKSYHVKAAQTLQPYLKTKELKDIWLKQNNEKNGGFTWFNHNKTIASRIDRIYLQKNLTNLVKEVYTAKPQFTDHKAVIVKIPSITGSKGEGFWKLNTTVLGQKEYNNKIQGMWYVWSLKKKEMKIDEWWDLGKKQIAALTIKYCKKLSIEKKIKIDNLNKQIHQEREKPNPEEKKISNLEAELETIGDRNSYGTQIRSKQNLAEELEVPTEYFYLQEKNRNTERSMTEMKVDGVITKDQDKIIKHVKDFYIKLYKNKGIDKNIAKGILNSTTAKCDDAAQRDLSKKISKEELFEALKGTEKNKSPGIDGIPYEFYIQFWEMIGEDLTEMINFCFKRGKLSVSQRRAVITLIPKGKKEKSKIENWRPISLQNCDIKIITKALAKRLETVMPNLIKKSQTCSIKGRQIYHHTLLLREIITFANITKKPIYILSFDQEKAFDQVSWEYLEMVLQHFQFPKTFTSYIRTLYTKIESTIAINGNLTTFFQVLRGLRQGCPLSLILYILISETLGNYIRNEKAIEGYQMPISGERVKHLQYADDTTGILKDLTEVEALLKLLQNYCAASGAVLNKAKTKGIHINHDENINLHCSIPVDWNKEDTKILGIIFTPNQVANRALNWKKVIENIEKRAKIMKTRSLSLKGKALIVNTILLSKAWHVGRVYMPTTEAIRKIQKIVFQYIWAKSHEPITRETLFQPCKKGGLGLLQIKNQCAALQIKDYFQLNMLRAPFWTQYAIFWNSKQLKLISSFWSQLPEYTLYRRNKPIQHNLLLQYLAKINPIDLNPNLNVKKIRELIMKEDETEYPKKSARDQIEKDFGVKINWEKALKSNFTTLGSPKHANIFFRILHNAVPALTIVKKWYRDANMNTICKVCGIEDETPAHIFLCPVWKEVWDLILPYINDIANAQTRVEEVIMAQYNKHAKACNTFAFCAMDYIYKARNQLVFDQKNILPSVLKTNIVKKIKKDLNLRYHTLEKGFVNTMKTLVSDNGSALNFKFE